MNKFRIYIFIFTISTSFLTFSQNDMSLTYESIRDSITKYNDVNIQKSFSFTFDYIKKALREKRKKEEFYGYYSQCILYYKSNDYKNALVSINLCITFSKRNSFKIYLIKSYLFRAIIKSKLSEWEDVSIIDDYHSALNIAKENNDFDWTLIISGRLSSFYTLSGEIEKSVEIQKETIKALKKEEKTELYGLSKKWGVKIRDYYNYITKAYILNKEIDSAKKYNELFYESLNKKNKDHLYWKREFFISEGCINLLLENTVLAKKFFTNAFKKIPNDEYESREYQKAYYMGCIAYKEKRYKDVIEILEPVDNKVESFYIFYTNHYKYLSKAYLHINNFEKANFYLDKQLTLISKNNKFQNNIKSKFKKNEIKEFNDEIKLIKKEKRNQKLVLILIMVILIFTIIILFVYNIKNKKKNKQKFDTLLQSLNDLENSINSSSIRAKSKIEINDSKVQSILKGLKLLEQKGFYLSLNCSLSLVAKKIDTNTSYLSKVINSHYQKNFNSYINELRINYVILRLKNDKLFRKYTIQAIANDIGFKSKESFNKAFKNQTGMLPSFYIKQLERLQ